MVPGTMCQNIFMQALQLAICDGAYLMQDLQMTICNGANMLILSEEQLQVLFYRTYSGDSEVVNKQFCNIW